MTRLKKPTAVQKRRQGPTADERIAKRRAANELWERQKAAAKTTGLGQRCQNLIADLLAKNDIEDPDKLKRMIASGRISEADMLRYPNFGRLGLKEILAWAKPEPQAKVKTGGRAKPPKHPTSPRIFRDGRAIFCRAYDLKAGDRVVYNMAEVNKTLPQNWTGAHIVKSIEPTPSGNWENNLLVKFEGDTYRPMTYVRDDYVQIDLVA